MFDLLEDYRTVCSSSLFFVNLEELVEVYSKFIDKTNELSIEKRLPIASFFRFVQILAGHAKKNGIKIPLDGFAEVLFLTKIFFSTLKITGLETPSLHIRNLLKNAFIEPVTPTSEMSVYGLELNIQLTNLLYDIFNMCSTGIEKSRCIARFARYYKIVSDFASKYQISDPIKIKEAFVSHTELSFHELFKTKNGTKSSFEDYLSNKNISIKNKLAFVAGFTSAGSATYREIQKYLCSSDLNSLLIFSHTHGLMFLPEYQFVWDICDKNQSSNFAKIRSRYVVNYILSRINKFYIFCIINDQYVKALSAENRGMKDANLGSLLNHELILKGCGSIEFWEDGKLTLAQECYCYKAICKEDDECYARLAFDDKFCECDAYKIKEKNLLTEVKITDFEENVLSFLVLEKESRDLSKLKRIVESLDKIKRDGFNNCSYRFNFNDGEEILNLICRLYSFLKNDDKTFQNLYDILDNTIDNITLETEESNIKRKLNLWFGENGEKLSQIGNKKLNVENILKYVKPAPDSSQIFYCLGSSEITEKTVLDYINKLRVNDDYLLKKTFSYKLKVGLANFEKQSDFCKSVAYKYLDKCYREDIEVFKKLPKCYRYLHLDKLKSSEKTEKTLELLNPEDFDKAFRELNELTESNKSTDSDEFLKNIIFKKIKENNDLYFLKLAEKYRTVENLNYINDLRKKKLAFACYLNPEETTYENFTKCFDDEHRVWSEWSTDIKKYKSELRARTYPFSKQESDQKLALLNNIEEWCKRSLDKIKKNKDGEKNETKKFVGRKHKSGMLVDIERIDRKKMPKLENTSQKNKDDKNDQDH